jgi:hypothetical protein
LTIIAEYLESSGTKHTLPPTDAAEYSYCPSGDSRVYRVAPCRARGQYDTAETQPHPDCMATESEGCLGRQCLHQCIPSMPPTSPCALLSS